MLTHLWKHLYDIISNKFTILSTHDWNLPLVIKKMLFLWVYIYQKNRVDIMETTWENSNNLLTEGGWIGETLKSSDKKWTPIEIWTLFMSLTDPTTPPPLPAGYDTSSIFKQSKTCWNREFSFSYMLVSPRQKNPHTFSTPHFFDSM